MARSFGGGRATHCHPRHALSQESGRRAIGLVALCAGLALLATCASVPDFDSSMGRSSDAAKRSEIIGAHGPLTAKQSKALLERLSTEAGDAGGLKRHLAIEEAVVAL